ncbi:Xaa-Pro peptidase family protein [Lentibacter algarum]|uniref:M24 family metallopeptidase n=1 Tax=Lentibacter algarum TaxID=576131 RepID=UPI001C070290|nr:Xaa-Pro peptidase family protein [Lentibacter algarum]MBU2980715.1 Xaa-Pro peptidase family protein [Lentibacter algarum]
MELDDIPRLNAAELHGGRHALYLSRLAHVREGMRMHNVAVMLVCDPNQIFYATGASNMQLWSTRTPARYLLLFQDGPSVLFDHVGGVHLAQGLPTITDIHKAEGLDYVSSGGDMASASARFAADITSLVRDHDTAIDTIHIDRLPYQAVDALRAKGFEVRDALEPLSLTRSIKQEIELPYVMEAMRRVEEGVARLENKAEPDKTEVETWAEFHYSLMAKEGQYASTRLFQSGPNTFPYFQEAGGRVLQKGDLLCLDTDAVAFENYAVDFSRTFLCGNGRATVDQKLLYARAREQLEWNAELLRPHVEYRELAEKAWNVPEEHLQSRYYCVGHGLGMAGEFPNIPHHDTSDGTYPLEGKLEPGMIICIESYIGWDKSNEGVKLEDQFLIHETGALRMSNYSFDERLQTRMI